MLGHRIRHWPNNDPALGQWLVFSGDHHGCGLSWRTWPSLLDPHPRRNRQRRLTVGLTLLNAGPPSRTVGQHSAASGRSIFEYRFLFSCAVTARRVEATKTQHILFEEHASDKKNTKRKRHVCFFIIKSRTNSFWWGVGEKDFLKSLNLPSHHF